MEDIWPFFFPVNFVVCESWRMNSFAYHMRTALFWVIMKQVVVISQSTTNKMRLFTIYLFL